MAAERLVKLLLERGYHVATAESCTGGLLSAAMVDISGASEVFEEGSITYSDRVKKKLLGVSGESLEKYTAVSRQVAEEMAKGARRAAGTEVSVSVTGYAGPDAGEDGTPAGTVYIGCDVLGEISVKECHFSGDRNEVRRKAAEEAVSFALENIMTAQL
ncbi:MAG: CinA family protein [Lachnospiraceae bacterium]|nr:CinA family protein [Lachnospiraceae bacterium]